MTSRSLPLLAARTSALETCGYCPRLCRAACPVSEAEPRETLTPWGKMTMAWLAARGDLDVDSSVTDTAWACTGCLACRERCDHRNPVADTLLDARADFLASGSAPLAARAVVDGGERRSKEVREVVARLSQLPGVADSAPTALLLGCGYARMLPAVAEDAVRVAVALAGPVRLLTGCCGAPMLEAGARAAAADARRALDASVGTSALMVVDAGCALALGDRSPRLLLDAVLDALPRLAHCAELAEQVVRWHDPCRLGRGLGRYDPPRKILERVLGRPPEEFSRNRTEALCSGGGGLVPLTFPEVSARTVQRVLRDHERLGAGVLVAGCAASHKRFASSGARVMDLVTVVRRALVPDV